MENPKPIAARRAAAKRLLKRLTVGIALAAVAGVGVLSTVAAQTIPSTQTAGATTSSASTSLQGSSSSVSSSSGSAVVVSGGSR